MNSPGALTNPPRPAFPRLALWAILLIPIFWFAADRTEFRSTVEFEANDNGVRLVINGQELKNPTTLRGLKTVSILSAPDFFSTGCESLVLTPEGSAPINLSVERRWIFPSPKTKPTGDWWADRYITRSIVFRQDVDVKGNFKLTGVFAGRSLQGFDVILEGERKVTFFCRSGSLNNDLGILVERGNVTRAIQESPSVDGRHFLHPFALAMLGASSLIALFSILGWALPKSTPSLHRKLPWTWLIGSVLIAGTALSLWVAWSVLGARPHFQDDLGYLLRAKWLLAGKFFLPVPAHSEHFGIVFTFFIKERWMSQYTLGWPALLAVGESMKMAWIIAPACGAILSYSAWQLGKECGGNAVGFVAATFAALSPLGLLLSGSMMSHTATSMWLALFLLCYIRGWRSERGRVLILGLGGLALGFAFDTRPLSAVAVALPAGLYGLVEMKRQNFGQAAWLGLAGILAGGILGALPQLLDNSVVTGHPLLFAYKLCKNESWALASYAKGLFWADRTLAQTAPMAFGWGWPLIGSHPVILAIELGFAAVPFVAGQARRIDWLLLGICLILPVAYMGYSGPPGLHGFGPRYYADGFFALFILTARGFQVLANLGAPSALPRIVAIGLLVVLVATTALSLRSRFEFYRDYNSVDDRIERILNAKGISRGLILMNGPMHLMWIRAARLLPVGVRGELVFAAKRDDNRQLIQDYPELPVYLLTDSTINPYIESATPHGP